MTTRISMTYCKLYMSVDADVSKRSRPSWSQAAFSHDVPAEHGNGAEWGMAYNNNNIIINCISINIIIIHNNNNNNTNATSAAAD
jgi:hypothetical protein